MTRRAAILAEAILEKMADRQTDDQGAAEELLDLRVAEHALTSIWIETVSMRDALSDLLGKKNPFREDAVSDEFRVIYHHFQGARATAEKRLGMPLVLQ